MSVRRKPPGGGRSRHKAFYAALYSSVGVMLALAVVIGYTNFLRPDPYYSADPVPDTGQHRYAGAPHDLYLWPGNDMNVSPLYPGWAHEAAEPVAGMLDEPYGAQAAPYGADSYGYEGAHIDHDAYVYYGYEDDVAWRRNRDRQDEDAPAPTPEVTPTPEPAPRREETFRSFDQYTDSMAWPVLGDIVMAYSVDHLIFDKTLDQFRTNDNICIGASYGDSVNAAAAGVVSEIFTTRERGRTVVVDHGNGWRTTYSQLQDEVIVRVGDVVTQNQKIGTVGAPSLFSTQLGYHIAFTVHNGSNTVDPRTVLR